MNKKIIFLPISFIWLFISCDIEPNDDVIKESEGISLKWIGRERSDECFGSLYYLVENWETSTEFNACDTVRIGEPPEDYWLSPSFYECVYIRLYLFEGIKYRLTSDPTVTHFNSIDSDDWDDWLWEEF